MSIQFSRRDLVRGMVGGAVGLALSPAVFSQVGAPPGKIALRFNENPYGPSPAARKAAYEAVDQGAYYADTIQENLLRIIADKHDLSLDNMVLSSGSNEALQAAHVAFGRKGHVLMPSLTYTDHVPYSRTMGVKMKTVPLRADLSIDLDAMAAAVDDDASLVYICNPNNPTGLTIDGDELREFCRSVGQQTIVIIDEAYNEITKDPRYTSMVDLVQDGENVIVFRTFSKIFGMAGMRVGYAMTRPDLARTIARHVMSWPNVAGLAAAVASINDNEFIGFSRSKIFEARDMVNETFRRNGIEPVPSQTNFVFADIGRNAAEFRRQMADRNVLIRGNYEDYPTYVRVSMGLLEDVAVFQRVFDDVYAANSG
jgi:histidinol-phosphate aminotransferase